MAKLYHVMAMLVLLSVASASANQTRQSLDSFLSSFNISASTENALSYTNFSYSGGNYSLAYYTGSPYLLINTTSGYSFVLNPASISSIIAPTIIQSSLGNINESYLSSAMLAYNKSSAAPINDCLTETGLNQPNATCTAANFCESCRAVPICGGVQATPASMLSQTGYNGPFQVGIEHFESNYTALISNLTKYNNALALLGSVPTAQSGLSELNSAFANLTSITEIIYQNPIWTPTNNQPSCNPALPPNQQPWYCVAYGFCGSINYNYTLLNNIQNYINRINAMPISQSSISSIAQSISNTGNKYAAVIIASDELKQRNHILNTTLLGYNGIIYGVDSLSIDISNSLLASKESTLEANYSMLINSYTTANLVSLNESLYKQYSALKSLYASLNFSYYSALKVSQNNTALLISLESESSTPRPQVIALSFQEANLNDMLTSKPSDITTIAANLSALNKQIAAVPHTTDVPSEIARSAGSPLATAILGASSFSNGVKYAPLAATVPAVVISVIVLLALFTLYKKLHRHGRIRRTRKTSKNWKILFVVAIIVLLIYIYVSYSSAVAANSSASLTDAASAIGSAKTVAIAINGTSNPYLAACESKIAGVLSNQSKKVYKISINGQACNTGSGVVTTDSCLGQYAYSGVPVIILTNSSRNLLTAYSFYGTILSQSGNQQFTNSCLASLFLG